MLLGFARARRLGEDDAEDVAQQCLESISQHIASFEYDPKRGGFKKWLRNLVNNRVGNLLRRRQERIAESGEFKRPQQQARSPEELWERVRTSGPQGTLCTVLDQDRIGREGDVCQRAEPVVSQRRLFQRAV